MHVPELQPTEASKPPLPTRLYERYAPDRLKILRASGKRWHRYRGYRFLTMLGSLGMLFLVPLVGLARFDLYSGDHRALGETVSTFTGLIAVGSAIFAFYFLTFQVNLVAGRMFCGWGCPVGQLNRLGDSVQSAKGPQRWLWWGAFSAFALALGGALLVWWSSPAVLLVFPYNLVALAAVLGIAATAIVFARVIGWNFCKKACPIGLYYSVVQQKRPIGILYDEQHCLDEEACVKACPVHLDPRDMDALRYEIGGLAIDGLSSQSHCLRCGECVEACDLVTSKVGPVALSFGRPPIVAERSPLVNADGLVQLPSRQDAPVNDVLLPAQAEPEGPALPARELFLTGGPEGLFGTGLSLLSVIVGSVVIVAVLLFFPTPLWTIVQGSAVWPRFLASGAATPLVTVFALLAQRRLKLAKVAPALGLLLSLWAVLGSTAYAAFSPSSGSRYRPAQTWEAPAASNTKPVEGYRAAPDHFTAGSIQGVVSGPDGPVSGAVVFLEAPAAGRPLDAPTAQAFDVAGGRWARPVYALHAKDPVLLRNSTGDLHTFHLTAGGRTIKNAPLTPGMSDKQLGTLHAGEYELSCDNHPTEKSIVVVVDHPYLAVTDEQGAFRLDKVPAGSVHLVAKSSLGSTQRTFKLEGDGVSQQEIRIERSTDP